MSLEKTSSEISQDANALYLEAEKINETSGFSAALDTYKKAANLGNTSAMVIIGSAYLFGNGVEENQVMTRTWLQKATDLGDSDGMYYLGLSYIDTSGNDIGSQQVEKWLLAAAKQEHLEAIHTLGCYYQDTGNRNKQ